MPCNMPPNKSRKKVKTGCRTCKIRKVKCDEGRPSCHSCVSTGRNCDGYGIWGGGGGGGGHANTGAGKANHGPQHRYGGQPPTMKWIPRGQDLSLTPTRMSSAEHGCYAWFFSKTSMKFAGIFCAPFWRRLVPQACFAEPAVLHATLALSAMHQKGVLGGPPPPPRKGGLAVVVAAADADDGERFALQQYSRAIAELQPHLRAGGTASVRVALIACLVFAALEFVRGRRRTGLAHLRSGLRLLGEAHGDPTAPRRSGGGGPSRCLAPRPARSFVDEWIIDVFDKLLVQVRLHGPPGGRDGTPSPRLVLPVRDPGRRFSSVLDARQHLDELLNGILDLADACRRDPAPADGKAAAGRQAAQRDLQRRLDVWRGAYEASDTTMQSSGQVMTSWGYALLLLHWAMARIMASTCLRPDDESVFDEHDEGFLAIVDHTVGLWRLFHSGHGHALDPMAQWDTKASKVTIDTGWVPPLYFLALKCRVPGVRQHAIRCLEHPQHTEGLWDTELASCIAKEVIRLEGGHEDDESAGYNDDAWLDRAPTKLDLAAPRPPRSRRLHGLQVTLPDGPAGQIVLEFQQGISEDGAPGPRIRVYDMISRLWTDSK